MHLFISHTLIYFLLINYHINIDTRVCRYKKEYVVPVYVLSGGEFLSPRRWRRERERERDRDRERERLILKWLLSVCLSVCLSLSVFHCLVLSLIVSLILSLFEMMNGRLG